MKSRFKEELEKGLTELNLEITKEQENSFTKHYELLIEWNQKSNLTSIVQPEEAAIKHFLDSIAAVQFFPQDNGLRLLDLGSGAGFPGLVFKILKDDLRITLVDSVLKKVNFLKMAIQELNLVGIEGIHQRAEDLGKDKAYREKYQIVTARAVAPMAVLVEYCLPFTALGGKFYALKGPNYLEELKEAEYGIGLLGGKLNKVEEYTLPILDDKRTIIEIEKIKSTPKSYPRKSGLVGKKPLIK